MKLTLMATLLSVWLPLLPAAAAPAPADPRAADDSYVPTAELKDAKAHAAELVTPGAATYSQSGGTVTGEDAGKRNAEVKKMDPATHSVFTVLSEIAKQYSAHDPFFICDTANERLKKHALYPHINPANIETAHDYFTNHQKVLTFLQKLLFRHWCVAHYPDCWLTIYYPERRKQNLFALDDRLQELQFNSYVHMNPQVKAKVHELYRKNLAEIQARAKLLPELWKIVFAYGGVPSWGCSLDEAYAISQQLFPNNPAHQLNLKGFGINRIGGTRLRGRNFYWINLANNLISELPPHAIACTSSIIFLNGNPLKAIAPGAFNNQPNLEELHICDGVMPRLKAGTFSGLTYLRLLDLNRCNIGTVDHNTFGDLYCSRQLRLGNTHLPRNYRTELQHLPFWLDGPCYNPEICNTRPALCGIRIQPLLTNNEFLLLRGEASALLDEVENTENAYRLKAYKPNASPHYDSPEYRSYKEAIEARNARLPRILIRMRELSDLPKLPSLKLPELPSLLEESSSGCTIS